MNDSLYALIQRRFPADLSQPLLLQPEGRTLTYGQLDELTARFAALLRDRGVKPGDRVAVQVEKSPEALFLYLACLRGGFVFLPMNTAYRPDEVDHLVGDATPAAVVCRPEDEEGMRAIAERHAVPVLFTLGTDGEGSFLPAAMATAPEASVAVRSSDDLAAMLYTSGTTGKPKGAMLTHGNLASNALALVEAWRFTSDDVLLHALPIFHVHGLFVASHCVLLSGARMIWLPRFEPSAIMAQLPNSTVLMGVPTYYTRLLAQPEFGRDQCRTMRLFVSGSAPMLADTHRAFQERTGHAILERYGMTETGMIAGNPYEGERVPGAVGVPFPGVEVRVVDEAGSVLTPGGVGEIQVRGPNVMAGYWRLPEKTKQEFSNDGWFKTGDVGQFDARGYLSIVGRAKDMIISGGYNVYPKEIEALIDELPGVAESAVVGVPHADFGEVGVAVIKPDGPHPIEEADVLAHLRGHLANYKVPKRVFFVDELPRNTMGKIQKSVLRDRFRDIFTGTLSHNR